jgi:hypothetical protein
MDDPAFWIAFLRKLLVSLSVALLIGVGVTTAMFWLAFERLIRFLDTIDGEE